MSSDPTQKSHWLYGWPEEACIQSFESAASLQAWVSLCLETQEVLGELGQTLVKLGLDHEIPPHDDIDKIIAYPSIRDSTLRLCNEVFQSITSKVIEEPSRALVLLGSKALRNTALCSVIVQRMLVQPTPDVLVPEITRSYLAGVFALLIGRHKFQVLNTSNFLVAGLLNRLGHWVVWRFGGTKAKALNEKRNKEKGLLTPVQEKAVLGFSCDELTLALVKAWKLSPDLEGSLNKLVTVDSPDYPVTLGIRLSNALFDGSKGESFIDVKREVHHYLGGTADELQDLILEGLERTVEGLSVFENPDLIDHVPYPKDEYAESINKLKEVEVNASLVVEVDVEKVKVILDKLHKISTVKNPDINEAFSLCAQGMVEGGDFDRVVVALLDPSRLHIHSKLIRQLSPESIQQRFGLIADESKYYQELHINLMKPEGYLIRNVLREDKIAWVRTTGEIVFKKLRKTAFNDLMGWGQFFIAPITLHHHRIGFYYCDRQLTNRKMDLKSYEVFEDICLQTNKTLAMIQAKDLNHPKSS